MKVLLFFIILFLLLGCDKPESNQTLNGEYPEGMEINDTTSINDCLLPECSEDRAVRLIASEVQGTILESIHGEYAFTYAFTFDSYIHFYICDLPEEFKQDGLQVIFDGLVLDACGIRVAQFPIEEVYTIKITDIREQ